MLLCALAVELKRTGVAESCLEHVFERYQQICRTHSIASIPMALLAGVAARLGAQRILLCETAQRHKRQKLALNVPMDDVVYWLKENAKKDQEFAWMKDLVDDRPEG